MSLACVKLKYTPAQKVAMRFSVRACRHCKKSVGFDDKTCGHCHKKLMNPAYFKMLFFGMFGVVILVYASLLVLYLAVQRASCEPESLYTRVTVNDLTCTDICTGACAEKGKIGAGLALTKGYSSDSLLTTLSCQCTCSC
jgi:hypothetical protein